MADGREKRRRRLWTSATKAANLFGVETPATHTAPPFFNKYHRDHIRTSAHTQTRTLLMTKMRCLCEAFFLRWVSRWGQRVPGTFLASSTWITTSEQSRTCAPCACACACAWLLALAFVFVIGLGATRLYDGRARYNKHGRRDETETKTGA